MGYSESSLVKMPHCWKSHVTAHLYFKDCGSIASPVDGSVSYSKNTTYQSVASFSCDTGYTISATTTRTCQEDKTWSYESPYCTINGRLESICD